MQLLLRLAGLITRVNEWIGRSVAWLTVAMVLVYFALVILRYVMDFGSIALQESVSYMHALVFMLAASWTLAQDGHVRVDIFYTRLSATGRAWVNLLGSLIFLLPISLFIFWVSLDYVADSWAQNDGRGEHSAESSGLPWVWLLKTAIPLMALQLALQGLAQAINNLNVIRQGSIEPNGEQ